jgi:NADPH:quinone reductase
MRAATITDGGVAVADHPDPRPGRGQVLVEVHAAGLNNADLQQRDGMYPAPADVPQDIPGMEFAGIVSATGPQAWRFSVGDRVMGLIGGGAQAELTVADERVLMPVPDCLSWAEAGAGVEMFTTAHDALFSQAGLVMGERLLVHGAAGGVGSAAIQLGRAVGAEVVATVRNSSLRSNVAEFGADAIAPDAFISDGPYDVILELVGGINMPANVRALADDGRICVIGVGAGATTELNLIELMLKRGRIYASTIRARSPEAKATAIRRVERSVVPLLADGRVTVPIADTFPLEAAADAYARFADGGKLGKIVLVTHG